MAVAATFADVEYWGSLKVTLGTLAFDASYPTAGEPYTAATFGLTTLTFLAIMPSEGIVFEPDSSASKIVAYWVDTTVDGAAMAQVANTTDLSAWATVPFLAIGT